MVLYNKNSSPKIEEAMEKLTQINTLLNKQIGENISDSRYSSDNEVLRAIRNENIKTIQLIQKMELTEMLEEAYS